MEKGRSGCPAQRERFEQGDEVRILIFSFYYPPDLCAGSFRIAGFLEALSLRLGVDDQVEVLTTMPNRYRSYRQAAERVEHVHKVKVVRFPLPPHESGFSDQVKAFAAYMAQCLWYLRGREVDMIYATSSRLFTAFLGALTCRWKKSGLYLDMRDIFADTMDGLLPGTIRRVTLPVFKLVEGYTLKSATKINLVSRGFEEYFRGIVPETELSFCPNGIDDDFWGHDFTKESPGQTSIITYAGNIGQGQGLEKILPVIAKQTEGRCVFRIIGDGGMRRRLEETLVDEHVANVEMFAPVRREELIAYYRQSDYLFLHLNDCAAFEKVLPSKLFEYAATGKPILAGVSGFAKDFIAENISDAVIFSPCDPQDFIAKFDAYVPAYGSREQFLKEFKRSSIMRDLADDFLQSCGR